MIRLVTATGVLEIMTVFRTSEIGTIAQGAESSGAFLFSLGERANRLLCRRSEEYPSTNRGTHLHEMVPKPLIRKGLRLVSCTGATKTLVGVGFKSLFV